MSNAIIDLIFENVQGLANESIDLEEFKESLEEFMDEFEYSLEESDERYKHDHLSAGQKVALGIGAAGAVGVGVLAHKGLKGMRIVHDLTQVNPRLANELGRLKQDIVRGGFKPSKAKRTIKAARVEVDRAEASGMFSKATCRHLRKELDKMERHVESAKASWFPGLRAKRNEIEDRFSRTTDSTTLRGR